MCFLSVASIQVTLDVKYEYMKTPKNYFHSRQVLALISAMVLLATLVIVMVLVRLSGGNNEGIIGQYHENLGLSAYTNTTISSSLSFIGFVVLVVVTNIAVSMRMYHRRKEFSVIVLWTGLLLVLLALVVSNSLAVL